MFFFVRAINHSEGERTALDFPCWNTREQIEAFSLVLAADAIDVATSLRVVVLVVCSTCPERLGTSDKIDAGEVNREADL